MKKRRLPTGIRNLRQIREEGYYYVVRRPGELQASVMQQLAGEGSLPHRARCG